MLRPTLLVCATLPAVVLFANGPSAPIDHDGHVHGPATVQFVKNEGQWQAPFLYRADANGATAFMERDGVTWVKLQEDAFSVMHDAGQLTLEQQAAIRFNGHAWRMHFDAAAPAVQVEEHDRASFYHNYFLGNDPALWRGHVPVFGELGYEQVWPGVDVVFHAAEGNLKYDVLLAPGADPASIGLVFSGLDGLHVNGEGNLVMTTSVGEVTELAPVAFYTDGAHEAIRCSFRLAGDRLGFKLNGTYDASRPVTIDPILIASTLSGCSGSSNYGHCATYDDLGNMYTGARNFGPTYPATLGAFQTSFGGGGTDMSHSKYNPDGSNLIWASYLGGNAGENPHSMIVNSQGQLCVMGSTASINFPTTTGAYDGTHNGGGNDMIITVFAADGSALVGSTFVGGSGDDGTNSMWGNYGEAYRGEIYLDPNDNVLVAGFSSSANFPTTAGAIQTTFGGGQDGVVLSVNSNCSSLLWSTFMGGTGDDGAFGLRLSNGSLFVCGSTESANFTTTPGAFQTTLIGGRDGWVAKMNTTGSALLASTFYGTTDDDRPYFLDTDNQGDIWIYGQSDGAIPIQPAGTYGNAGGSIFVAKFISDLATVPVSTMMGGNTAPVAFLVDHCDHVYLSGFNSNGLPTTPDMLYGSGSFWLAAFDVDMVGILFGTYYGGSHVDGGTSRFDKNGIIYQGVCSGMGSLQTTAWAWAQTQSVGWDIGVFKIDFQAAGVNAAGASSLNQGCAPIVIDFSNTSTGTNWVWDFGDGSALDTTYAPSHLYTTAGVYTVMLVAFDSLSCNLADTITFPITIGQSQVLT
ncbi:MAG: PKD domain-containing protein, partial [Flavobacteriales bacterium]